MSEGSNYLLTWKESNSLEELSDGFLLSVALKRAGGLNYLLSRLDMLIPPLLKRVAFSNASLEQFKTEYRRTLEVFIFNEMEFTRRTHLKLARVIFRSGESLGEFIEKSRRSQKLADSFIKSIPLLTNNSILTLAKSSLHREISELAGNGFKIKPFLIDERYPYYNLKKENF